MKRLTITFAAILITIFAASSFAQNSTPAESVRSFYEFNRKHDRSFTRTALEARKQWFSEDLYKLLLSELKRETLYLKKNPTDKPYFEGLPFDPIDETCAAGSRQLRKQVMIRPDAQDDSVATVRAIFAFPSPCKEPDTTIYTIEVVRAPAGWVIDNVVYEDGSTLVAALKRKDY